MNATRAWNSIQLSPGHYSLSQAVLTCPQVSYSSLQFPLASLFKGILSLWFFKTPGLENHREKTLPIVSYRCWLALSAPLCSLWSSISFILELGVKELVSELLVTYICHKHGLSKATHFSPDFVLTLFPSSPGCGVTSPWGLMTSPGTLHLFTTHTGKTTPAKFPHSGSTCKIDAGGALEKRQEYQSPKILAAQLPS